MYTVYTLQRWNDDQTEVFFTQECLDWPDTLQALEAFERRGEEIDNPLAVNLESVTPDSRGTFVIARDSRGQIYTLTVVERS